MKKNFPFYKGYENGKRINLTEKNEKKLSDSDKKVIKDFCFYCSINSKAKKRADNIRRVMIQFCDFLEKPLSELQDKDLIYFAEAIGRSERTIEGKNDVRIVVRRFVSWLQEHKGKKFPSLKIIKLEKSQGSNKIKTPNDLITELEFDKLMRATKNLMHKTLICMLWESAGRPEEILKLRWNDIDFNKRNVKLHSGKTGTFRIVPLDVTINHLERLKEESNFNDGDLIFTSQQKGNMLGNTSFNFIIKRLSQKAGIKRHISGYTFRHTKLSSLIKTLSPKSYEMFAGHSLEMGMKTYAHLNVDDLTKEMRDKVFGIKELTKEEKGEIKKLREGLGSMKKQVDSQEKSIAMVFKKLLEKEGIRIKQVEIKN